MSDISWNSEKRRLSDLIPWDHNPRQLTDKQASHLKESIRRFGQVIPFSVSPNNEIYDGHQRNRVMAMMEEYGPGVEVDVRVASRPLTDQERKELVIRLHENTGEWDFDGLANLYDFEELAEWGFDENLLDKIGFTSDDPPEDPGAEMSIADELREKWGVESGQLWQLGTHRVICGDCTDEAVVERLMGGEKAEIMVTDPPYGVEYEADWRNKALGEGDRAIGIVKNDDIVDWSSAWLLFGGDVVYCWHADLHASKVEGSLTNAGFGVRCQIIWSKPHFVIGRGHYSTRHEPCWYAVRAGRPAQWVGNSNEQTVWDISLDDRAAGGHSTQKPIECMERPIRNHNLRRVYDPFLGSGTTLIACERLNRKCYGIEIAPEYVAVTLERWHQMTGEEPVLLDTLKDG